MIGEISITLIDHPCTRSPSRLRTPHATRPLPHIALLHTKWCRNGGWGVRNLGLIC